MFTYLLPIAITIFPVAVIIFLAYHLAGKKAGNITILTLGIIFLVTLVSILFGTSSSDNKNVVSSRDKEMISQAVEVHYPGAQYSVSGKLVTLPGETHKQYRVEITSEYDEARYTTFNKAACAHLDKNTEVIAIISNGGLSPQKGKGGSCQYWLSK